MADPNLFRDKELQTLANHLRDRLNFYGNRDFGTPLTMPADRSDCPLVHKAVVTDQLNIPVTSYPLIRVYNELGRIPKDSAKARRVIRIHYELILPNQATYQAIAWNICKYLTSIINDSETVTRIPVEEGERVWRMSTSRVNLQNTLISIIDTQITIRSGI